MSSSPINSPLSEADREATGTLLQATLVDLVDLALIGKQAHWNVVGKDFRSVHLQLDELVKLTRGYLDDVAERTSAIGLAPDGRARTVVNGSGLPEYPAGWQSDRSTTAAIVSSLEATIKRLRPRIDESDKSDLVTQDLLIQIAAGLEKQHWMWQVQLA